MLLKKYIISINAFYLNILNYLKIKYTCLNSLQFSTQIVYVHYTFDLLLDISRIGSIYYSPQGK